MLWQQRNQSIECTRIILPTVQCQNWTNILWSPPFASYETPRYIDAYFFKLFFAMNNKMCACHKRFRYRNKNTFTSTFVLQCTLPDSSSLILNDRPIIRFTRLICDEEIRFSIFLKRKCSNNKIVDNKKPFNHREKKKMLFPQNSIDANANECCTTNTCSL